MIVERCSFTPLIAAVGSRLVVVSSFTVSVFDGKPGIEIQEGFFFDCTFDERVDVDSNCGFGNS